MVWSKLTAGQAVVQHVIALDRVVNRSVRHVQCALSVSVVEGQATMSAFQYKPVEGEQTMVILVEQTTGRL